jgi:thioredoxin reductase (NADPH)
MRRQAEKYGAQIASGRVEALEPVRRGFRIISDGKPLHARTVILATGVVDNTPDLPDLEDGVAKGLVRFCPICDGYEVIGQTVGVIGRDDHCAREAIFIRTWSDDVTFINVGRGKLAKPLLADLKRAQVKVIDSAIQGVVIEKRRITAFDFGAGAPRRFDAVYSALGVTARNQLAVQAGARLDDTGRLVVGEHQETSVPGLYAAGDVVRGLNQISTAEGEGAVAATHIHNALR